MNDFLDKLYDDMSLQDVVCRLPSDLAISALKRRVKDLDGFYDLCLTPDGKGALRCKELRKFANQLVRKTDVKSLFVKFAKKTDHPMLFKWLDQDNVNRLRSDAQEYLTVEFLYNMSDKENLDDMSAVISKILSEDNPKISQITTMLNNISTDIFQSILEKVIKDKRPSIRSSILSVHHGHNNKTISDFQKMIALKAFAKMPSSEKGSGHIQPIDFKLFKDMKPLERIMALDRYLDYFPVNKKIQPFKPSPSEKEFKSILFAGAFKHIDLVEEIVRKYKAITEDEEVPDKP